MTNKKGITLIELVVVVIILIILSVVAIWITANSGIFDKAQAASLYGEMKGVYTGVLHIKENYDHELIEDYVQGRDYCARGTGAGDENYYYIYGLDVYDPYKSVSETGEGGETRVYNEDVVRNLGMQELNRSYRVTFTDPPKVELLFPMMVGNYEIKTYEDIVALKESGAI